MLRNSDKYIEANKDLTWDKVFDLKPLPEGCVDGRAIFGRVPAPPPRKP